MRSGRCRTMDGEFRIDPSGELIGGRKFADIKELKQLLASTATQEICKVPHREYVNLWSWDAGLEAYDYCTVEDIRKQLAANDYRIHHIIFGIVESKAFQYRGVAEMTEFNDHDPPNHAPRHGSRPRPSVDGEPAGLRSSGQDVRPSRPSGCVSGTFPTACTCRPGSPSNEGALVDLPETLQPLSFAREYLNCFHGLTHNTALTNGDSEGCGHGQGSASFLTGAQAYKTQDAVRVGISADQLYARSCRQRDPLSQPRAGLRVGPLRQRVRLQRDLQDAHLLAHADLARRHTR